MALLYKKKSQLFNLKIVYSYANEIDDSESDLGLHSNALVSEVIAFYHFLENARGGPGRRDHIHLGQKKFCFLILLRVIRVFEGF